MAIAEQILTELQKSAGRKRSRRHVATCNCDVCHGDDVGSINRVIEEHRPTTTAPPAASDATQQLQDELARVRAELAAAHSDSEELRTLLATAETHLQDTKDNLQMALDSQRDLSSQLHEAETARTQIETELGQLQPAAPEAPSDPPAAPPAP